jgi:hypothetical protein
MKKWYQSKMLWLAVAEVFGATLLKFSELQPDHDWAFIVLAGLGVITATLRMNTTTKLTK